MKLETAAQIDERTCRLICPIAAGMVGVCLTGISLLRVANSMSHANTWADDLLAADAMLFLVATLSAYFALRVRTEARLHGLERVADATFIAGLVLLTAACFLITYAMKL